MFLLLIALLAQAPAEAVPRVNAEFPRFDYAASAQQRRGLIANAAERRLREAPDAVDTLDLLAEVRRFDDDGHSARAASAFRSSGALAPARNFRRPAAAIIAALSVDSVRLGRQVGSSRRWPRAWSSARKRLFAETPPAMAPLFA